MNDNSARIFVVGDVQGCWGPLQRGLQAAGFREGLDRLWLVGDLVNRGPDSLTVLRWVRGLGARATVVLGNHDLHLLVRSVGAGAAHALDTLDEVLAAPDAPALLGWLRQQKLVHAEAGYLMVHAGLWPSWSAAQALALSAEVEAALQGPQSAAFLQALYGNQPDHWQDAWTGMDRLRAIVNICTRMRMLQPQGEAGYRLDYKFKGPPAQAAAPLLPWFAVPAPARAGMPVLCGHWSALGYLRQGQVWALDTGCLWGRHLTVLCLESAMVTASPWLPGELASVQGED